MSMDYAITRTVKTNFQDTIHRLTSVLKDEGFGIITEIDLKSKFKEKLDKDFRNYKILGACNPKIAYEAIQKESRIGVMLPCNILVQEHDDGKVEVSAINPMQSIGVIGNAEIEGMATQVTEKLKAALDRI